MRKSQTWSIKLDYLTRPFTHAILNMYHHMLKKLAVAYIWFVLTPPIILLSAFILIQPKATALGTDNSTQTIDAASNAATNSIDGQVLGVEIEDTRPYIVSRFLDGTPLEPHSKLIVEVSDKYDIDYRLIPAIAMKESQGGLAVDQSTHNAWGFENGRTVFASWDLAIESVGKTLKTRYIDKGRTTPDEIMAIYAPPQLLTGGKWAKDINLFFSQMETL